jgi:hypothetical protein
MIAEPSPQVNCGLRIISKSIAMLFLLSTRQSLHKAHIGWLREVDANTKLVHLHARHHKQTNFIAKLVSGDHIYTKHEDKAQMVDQFYENLLGTSTDRENTNNLNELGITSHNLSYMYLPFME